MEKFFLTGNSSSDSSLNVDELFPVPQRKGLGGILSSILLGSQSSSDLQLPPNLNTNSEGSNKETIIGLIVLLSVLFGGIYLLTKIEQ